MADSTGSAGSTGSTSETIEVHLGDGTTVYAAVRDGRAGRDAGDAGAVSTAVRHTFDQVRETVQAVGQWARDTAVKCGDPSSFEVEFGVTLSVQAGRLIGVLAEAGGEASLNVRLTWDHATAGTAATA
ncbi:CU044_2847 family protein [Streptomyces sp. SP17BM10]|uniref:CU044_2847 family protein n=1 Tax=Streptomyces sp. SP17BM10 TaxID=3002530 RepID=UPI002E765733|nr:CU044_2847 family protein [Streptomyces sp. SP17BM10]MEE1784566.1 CU044_2847 family protein [Streptomyces sp. SP17BM10]